MQISTQAGLVLVSHVDDPLLSATSYGCYHSLPGSVDFQQSAQVVLLHPPWHPVRIFQLSQGDQIASRIPYKDKSHEFELR